MKTFDLAIRVYVEEEFEETIHRMVSVTDDVAEDNFEELFKALHAQWPALYEDYNSNYPSFKFEISEVLLIIEAPKANEEILPIEFTFKCPDTVHHIFGIKPEDYDKFGLPDFVFKGVKRFPDWMVKEIEYWNQFRGRTVSSSGYSPYDPYRDEGDESEITNDGKHVIQSEEEIKHIQDRYVYGGLEVPKDLKVKETFGQAFPPEEEKDAHADNNDADEYGYVNPLSGNDRTECVDSSAPIWLGNISEYFKDLSKEEKQIGILLQVKKGWSLLCESRNILVVCSETGKSAGFERLQRRDIVDTTLAAQAMIAPGTDLRCAGPNHTVLALLSVEALKNSPSKGERVVLNLFNSDEETDNYGYCY